MKKIKLEKAIKIHKEKCCFILLENDSFYNGLFLIDDINNKKVNIKINDYKNYSLNYNDQELYKIN